MATLTTDQNNLIVIYKIIFDNGLQVVFFASPLSPESGREVLGQFTEDYTLVGLLQPKSFAYPFLKGIPMGETYIADQLGIVQPFSSLMQAIMPWLTRIDLPDLIVNEAEKWYASFYGQSTQLTLIT